MLPEVQPQVISDRRDHLEMAPPRSRPHGFEVQIEIIFVFAGQFDRIRLRRFLGQSGPHFLKGHAHLGDPFIASTNLPRITWIRGIRWGEVRHVPGVDPNCLDVLRGHPPSERQVDRLREVFQERHGIDVELDRRVERQAIRRGISDDPGIKPNIPPRRAVGLELDPTGPVHPASDRHIQIADVGGLGALGQQDLPGAFASDRYL